MGYSVPSTIRRLAVPNVLADNTKVRLAGNAVGAEVRLLVVDGDERGDNDP